MARRDDEYLLVRGDVERVLVLVNNAIADGWLPLGAPFATGGETATNSGVGREIVQALVCGDTAARLEGSREREDPR